jgi:mRNA interferase MazF
MVANGMKKDFDGWNEKKKQASERDKAPFCHEREIWWCALGVNIGFEQDGSGNEYRRPILVLRGLSAETCLAIPLTASAKRHPLRPFIGKVENKDAHALLSQMRVIDTKRLVRKIGYLDKAIFEDIRKAAREML